jgi:hypothetical protein
MPVLEALEHTILRGYGQYNKGERVVVSDRDAAALLTECPDSWRRCQEDAITKAPTGPPRDKMTRLPERKK